MEAAFFAAQDGKGLGEGVEAQYAGEEEVGDGCGGAGGVFCGDAGKACYGAVLENSGMVTECGWREIGVETERGIG